MLLAAVIQGAVVENQSGKPVARAEVMLEAVTGRVSGNARVLTGVAGEFRFENLEEGSYRISARRKGFETARYGQQRPGEPGSPVVLAADGYFSAELRLRRPAAILGLVADENGLGLPGVQVFAYSAGRRAKVAASAETDDRGRFRLSPLAPGRYRVAAGPHVLEDGTGLLPTWLGNVTEREQGRVVELEAEQEAGGFVLSPVVGRLGRIRGTVAGEGVTRILLRSAGAVYETNPKIGNSFSFDGLAPGWYELFAKGTQDGKPVSAWKRVRLTGEDLYVQMAAGELPRVRVHCRDAQGKALGAGVASLFPEPLDPWEALEVRLACGEEKELDAGEYRLRAVAASEVYLESISVRRSADLESETYELALEAGGRVDVILTFGGKPSRVVGSVKLGEKEAAPGAPVYLRALDPELYARSGGLRYTRADGEGRFRFDGLPPGEYEAVSSFRFTRERAEEWERGLGTALRVQEGKEEAVDLQLF
jgi:protocatechuate 3,4-dioxygenase beta subunit